MGYGSSPVTQLAWGWHLGSIPGKAEVENVDAAGIDSKVGLQLPTGQLCLQQQGQVAKDKGVQGGGGISKRE